MFKVSDEGPEQRRKRVAGDVTVQDGCRSLDQFWGDRAFALPTPLKVGRTALSAKPSLAGNKAFKACSNDLPMIVLLRGEPSRMIVLTCSCGSIGTKRALSR